MSVFWDYIYQDNIGVDNGRTEYIKCRPECFRADFIRY